MAAGRESMKNIRSSTLVKVIREAAFPAGMPFSINMASLTYPPPKAVGLTAAPRSHPITILKISLIGKWVPKNRVHSLSRMLLVIQGTRASKTANKIYSKENSFKTRKIPLSVSTSEKIILAITPKGIRIKRIFKAWLKLKFLMFFKVFIFDLFEYAYCLFLITVINKK